jgi:RNA polymerase sigma-70 factor, ECF subfamily
MTAPTTHPLGPMEDNILLQAALDGDRRAWEQFYRRFDVLIRKSVCTTLHRYRGDVSEADSADFVAEVWVALLRHDRRKLRLFDPSRCSISTWIRRLATNCTIDQLRSAANKRASLRENDDVLDVVADTRQPRADIRILREEEADMARLAVTQLRVQDQAFVKLWLCDSRDHQEKAAELGITMNTFRSRQFKIKEKLARQVRRIQSREQFLSAA